MIQQSRGLFRADSTGANLKDLASIGSAYGTIRTPGSTLMDTVNLSPKQNQKWSLQSIGITLYLMTATAFPAYGLPGKIIGGLVPVDQGQQTAGAAAGVPYTAKLLPLPSDPSLTVPLWDPEVDQALPQYPASFTFASSAALLNNFLAVSGILQLPQSLPLQPGESITIGLWMLPSTIGSSVVGGTYLPQAGLGTYALTYDNGL